MAGAEERGRHVQHVLMSLFAESAARPIPAWS